MSCCGQKRQQWQPTKFIREPQKSATEPKLESLVAIQYRGVGSYLIKGKQTGYVYLFGNADPFLNVDGRDAPSLLEDKQRFSLA